MGMRFISTIYSNYIVQNNILLDPGHQHIVFNQLWTLKHVLSFPDGQAMEGY